MIEFPLPMSQEHRLTKEPEAAACDDPIGALVKRQARFIFRVAYSLLRNAHDVSPIQINAP